MTNDSKRLEAAVKAWDHYWGDRYGDEALEEMGEEVSVALAAADAVMFNEAAVWKAAEVAALVDDHDGCFEHVREYEAMEPWEQEAHGYPSSDYEARDYWLKRTRAVIAALKGVRE